MGLGHQKLGIRGVCFGGPVLVGDGAWGLWVSYLWCLITRNVTDHTTGVEVKNLCGSDWPCELMEEGPRGSLRISTPFHLGASLYFNTLVRTAAHDPKLYSSEVSPQIPDSVRPGTSRCSGRLFQLVPHCLSPNRRLACLPVPH